MTSKPRKTGSCSWWMALVLVAVGSSASCRKNAETSSPPDGASGGGADAASPETSARDLVALEQQLAQQTDQLDAMSKQGAVAADGETPEKKCARICELETSICELSDAICGLADDHTDETQYTDACLRSDGQCTRAQEACNACSA